MSIATLFVAFGIHASYADEQDDIDQNIADAIDATQAAMDRLVDQMEDLNYTIEEAEPYGEEPYFEDMTGQEIIEECIEEMMETVQEWLDFQEQLQDLQEIQDPTEGTWA